MASECWLWGGFIDKDGYGMFSAKIGSKKTTLRAHRAVYEDMIGMIPPGLTIDHLCEVRRCINPEHLKPATNRQNVLRSKKSVAGINVRKSRCVNGHDFDRANTYIRLTGGRMCRKCRTIKERSRRGV